MDLLLSPQLFSLYINNLNKIVKSQEENLISLIFNNVNNQFILNRKLLDKYESEFAPQSNELDRFQNELVMLLDNKSINISSSKNSLLDILNETNDNYLQQKNDRETYVNLSVNAENSINNDFSAILDNYNNLLSRDHIYFYLAAYNPIGLTKRYYDFASNKEIKDFLENIYKIRTHNEINIFDRNINLGHSYYNFFKNKRHQFKYFTIFKKDLIERSDDYRTLNSFFARCSMLIYRGAKINLHERRIMFNNIIIEFDNDIANILVTEPTWKLNIYVCNKIWSKIEQKKVAFTRDTTT